MSESAGRAIGFDDASDHARARDVFAAANYSEDGLREVLGSSELLFVRPIDLPAGLRRAGAGTPLHTLMRLFFFGVSVGLEAAREAVAPMALERWAEAALVGVADDRVTPLVKVLPYQGLLFAADMPARIHSGAPDDFVLGVSKSSVLLAHTVVPRPVRRTLDLGTGCGILALLAGRHSEQVSGTDKNLRAVAFARFNARLNGVQNVDFVSGDLFEPVAGRRFDLVISNPPYVISPTLRYLFCDSGVRGDEFCRQLARAAPAFLEEGGYCQIMANWAQGPGQSWQDPLAGWFDDTGCDAIVWGAETQDAASYATAWIQQTEHDALGRLPELFDTWMRYFDGEGIDGVTYGLITLRRRSGHPNWVQLVKVPSGMSAPGGPHVLRRFQAQDFLESAGSDHALLEHRFRLAPDVRIEQHYAPKADGFASVATRLHLGRDPGYYTMEADATVTTLVMCYHGERRLRDVLDDMATAMRLDVDRLTPGGLAVVRRLVQSGYLLPSSLPD